MFRNKSKRKRNFIRYYFLVKSKPHERIDLLITASVNIYQTKEQNSNSNGNLPRKTDETIWKPPLSKEPLSLSINPPISEEFFHHPQEGGEKETMKLQILFNVNNKFSIVSICCCSCGQVSFLTRFLVKVLSLQGVCLFYFFDLIKEALKLQLQFIAASLTLSMVISV